MFDCLTWQLDFVKPWRSCLCRAVALQLQILTLQPPDLPGLHSADMAVPEDCPRLDKLSCCRELVGGLGVSHLYLGRGKPVPLARHPLKPTRLNPPATTTQLGGLDWGVCLTADSSSAISINQLVNPLRPALLP